MKALYLLLIVSGSAVANDAALLKCRSMSDPSARLGCYDAIRVGAAPTAPTPVPATHGAPVLAAAPKQAAQDFGLEAQKQKKQEENAVESTIVGSVSGWTRGAQITLANGQVWRVLDGSDAFFGPFTNPKAKVERNYFGTMFITVEGSNHSAKVRRIK